MWRRRICTRLSYCVASLQALIEEFKPELTSKVGKLDSDPHLWMPVSCVLDARVLDERPQE